VSYGVVGWPWLSLSLAMNKARQYAALFLVLYCATSCAAGSDFYRLFQAATTNEQMAITSPLLVDTNNMGFKSTNVLLHLKSLKPNGEPSGIRLGMSMEQVVAKWGKPFEIMPRWCLGGPCFFYADAHVWFGAGRNSVQAIDATIPEELARTLPAWPTVEDCIRKLGKPSQRKDYADGTHCYLVYDSPKGRFRLGCAFGKLTTIEWGRELVK
jgi:hypothetical protein